MTVGQHTDQVAVPAPLVYRAEEVARLLSIGRTRVYELIGTGQLASIKIGRSRRVTPAALDDFLARSQAGEGSAD